MKRGRSPLIAAGFVGIALLAGCQSRQPTRANSGPSAFEDERARSQDLVVRVFDIRDMVEAFDERVQPSTQVLDEELSVYHQDRQISRKEFRRGRVVRE